MLLQQLTRGTGCGARERREEKGGTTVILSSGCYVSHPLVSCVIDRVFLPSQFHRRGKGREIVPPEDVVAMGCAIHRKHCV